jgi:hypothetical protein
VGQLSSKALVADEYGYYRNGANFRERIFVKNSVRDVVTTLRKGTLRVGPLRRRVCKGILGCVRYFAAEDHCRYGIVSRLSIPHPLDNMKPPRSPQSLLCGPENQKGSRHDLNDRIMLARSIAWPSLRSTPLDSCTRASAFQYSGFRSIRCWHSRISVPH